MATVAPPESLVVSTGASFCLGSVQLNHSIQLSDSFTLNSQAYYNKYKRDWFKTSLGSLIDRANDGDAEAQAQLDGEMDLADIGIKHNNRNYKAKGVQVSADWQLQSGAFSHDLTFGLRRHRDEVDRFQPVEVYDQVGGKLAFDASLMQKAATIASRKPMPPPFSLTTPFSWRKN